MISGRGDNVKLGQKGWINLPFGTGFNENELQSTFPVHFQPNARYNWDTGEAINRFLTELKGGRLITRFCKECNRKLIPPRMFCELCFRETDDWVHVGDLGAVNTFSICYISWDMRKLTTPEIPAVIDIDGTSGGFLHLLGEVDPKQVKTGMRVKAVWLPEAERKGSITDMKYFAPIK